MKWLTTAGPDFEAAFRALLEEARETTAKVDGVVAGIIAAVRNDGDAALIDLTARFDRWRPKDVGALRVKAITAGAPLIMDCVVAGHDREEIGILIFPNPAACLSLCPGSAAETPLSALASRPEVRAALEKGLRGYHK